MRDLKDVLLLVFQFCRDPQVLITLKQLTVIVALLVLWRAVPIFSVLLTILLTP